VVTIFTTSLTFTNPTFCPHTVFMRFVLISEQTAIISLFSINWLDFITETECVYCAVRTGSLCIIQVHFGTSRVISYTCLILECMFENVTKIIDNKKSSMLNVPANLLLPFLRWEMGPKMLQSSILLIIGAEIAVNVSCENPRCFLRKCDGSIT
jgi:hypothetical protein